MIICTMNRTIEIIFGGVNETALFQPFFTTDIPFKLVLPIQMTRELREKIKTQREAYIKN